MVQKGELRWEYVEAYRAGNVGEVPAHLVEQVADLVARLNDARRASERVFELKEKYQVLGEDDGEP
jgi:hypothetical protein